MLLAFMAVFDCVSFCDTFSADSLPTANFLRWVYSKPCSEAEHLVALVSEKHELRGSRTDFTSMFPRAEPAGLRELGTEQVRQILRTALCIHRFNNTDARVGDMFHHVFVRKQCSLTYVLGGSYLQLAITDGGRKRPCSLAGSLSRPSCVEVLFYLHALQFLERKRSDKSLHMSVSYKVGTRVALAVQHVFSVWKHLIRVSNQDSMRSAVFPYLYYRQGQFQVLRVREDGFAPASQMERFNVQAEPVISRDEVLAEVWGRADILDSALRTVAAYMLNYLHELLLSAELYALPDATVLEWDRLKNCTSVGDALPPMCASLARPVAEALDITVPLMPGLPIFTLNEEGIIVGEQSGWQRLTGAKNDIFYASRRQAMASATTKSLKRMGRVSRSQVVRRTRRRTEGIASEVSTAAAVKTEDVVLAVPTVTGEGVESSVSADTTILQEALKTYCNIYDVRFQDLPETMELSGISLFERVEFVLTDPPYNIRRERGRSNSDYDVFTLQDMNELVGLFSEVMELGAHGHLFCADVQFKDWLDVLSSQKETVEYQDLDGNTVEREEGMFGMEQKSLVYVRHKRNYQQHPSKNSLYHVSMTEHALHFWRLGGDHEQLLARLDYRSVPPFPSEFAMNTNVMTNVPRLSHAETVYDDEPGGSSRSRKLRPEQKPVDLMRAILRKFTKPGSLVFDPCAGTGATAKACLLESKHRKFVGCEADRRCFELMRPSLLLVFASQVLNEASDIVEGPDVVAAARRFCAASSKQGTEMRRNVWMTRAGLPPLQVFPIHVTHFVSQTFFDGALFHDAKYIPCNLWSEKWYDRLNAVDAHALLVHECCILGVMVQPSSIEHPRAGRGCFAARYFQKGETIGFYYGTLIYQDLTAQKNKNVTIGEGCMSVTVLDFETCAIRLRSEVPSQDGKANPVWIVPAHFNAMRFINDPRAVPGEEESTTGSSNARVANASFIENEHLKSREDFRRHDALTVVARRVIAPGEEIFVDYGSDYTSF